MRKDLVEEAKKQKKLIAIIVVAVLVIAAIVTGVIVNNSKSKAAQAEKNRKLETTQDVQREALQKYYKKRFKEYKEIRNKMTAEMTDAELAKKTFVSPVVKLFDENKDGIPEIVIDHPAMQHESEQDGVLNVSFDGQYVGNIRVGVYLNGKVEKLPKKPNTSTDQRASGTHPFVYMSDDHKTISIVVKADGESGEYDGYLYKITDTGVKEVSHEFGVSERYVNSKGDIDTPPAFKKFQKTYMPEEGFTMYKEKLSYEEDGNMTAFSNVTDYSDYLSTKGIMLNKESGADYWRELYTKGEKEEQTLFTIQAKAVNSVLDGYSRIPAKYNKKLPAAADEAKVGTISDEAQDVYKKVLDGVEADASWYVDLNDDGASELLVASGKTLSVYEFSEDQAVSRGEVTGLPAKHISAVADGVGVIVTGLKGSKVSYSQLSLKDGKLQETKIGSRKYTLAETLAGFEPLVLRSEVKENK